MGSISGVNRGASSYFNKNAPPGNSSHGNKIGSSGMPKPGGPSAYGGYKYGGIGGGIGGGMGGISSSDPYQVG
jgi:hypothetical protein